MNLLMHVGVDADGYRISAPCNPDKSGQNAELQPPLYAWPAGLEGLRQRETSSVENPKRINCGLGSRGYKMIGRFRKLCNVSWNRSSRPVSSKSVYELQKKSCNLST